MCLARHGELFGISESSPDFSPLIGGPKREAVLAEEYTMRNLRIDPFVYSGNTMGAVVLLLLSYRGTSRCASRLLIGIGTTHCVHSILTA